MCCVAETWPVRTVDQKHLESFDMWGWRRMEISWTDNMRNKEVLHRVKKDRKTLNTTKKKAN